MLDKIPFRKIITQPIESKTLDERRVALSMLRLDQTHDIISGNKWFKLMYNVRKAHDEGHTALLTFGGAYSNHIVATAEACSIAGLNSIGVIRGEPTEPLNPTLLQAIQRGMKLHYVTRTAYRNRKDPHYIQSLHALFGKFYHVPEGGSNVLGVTGAKEITSLLTHNYDYICCPCGTGGTIAGVICSNPPCKKILGFPALKGGGFLHDDIVDFFVNKVTTQWKLVTDYHFGGYAKVNEQLLTFIRGFYNEHHIKLDPVYTGKMMYGVDDMIQNGRFPEGSSILAIHTGGLQGIEGMEDRLGELIY